MSNDDKELLALAAKAAETVARLLAEHRKKVLLDAAEVVGELHASCKDTEQAHYRLSPEPFNMERFSFNPAVIAYSRDKADELRRMAEGEK